MWFVLAIVALTALLSCFALALAAPSFKAESISFTDLDDFVWGDTTGEGMWIYSGDWAQIPGYVQGYLNGTI